LEFIGLDLVEECSVLLPEFVELTEGTEGALSFESFDVCDDVGDLPLCYLVAVNDVFTELPEVVALSRVFNLYDGKILANAISPLGSEAATVNPRGVNESVNVEVPPAPLISNLK
jgi:hypothetical protein